MSWWLLLPFLTVVVVPTALVCEGEGEEGGEGMVVVAVVVVVMVVVVGYGGVCVWWCAW